MSPTKRQPAETSCAITNLISRWRRETYQELVSKLKDTYQEKDASKISEHLAIQFNIQGEAEGALYLEIANGQLHVEPYEYYDRDILVTTSAADLLALAQGSLDILEAYQSGKISAEGKVISLHRMNLTR